MLLCETLGQSSIPLRGTVKDGLYVFSPLHAYGGVFVNSTSFTNLKPTIQTLHERLGHCSYTILQQVSRYFNI